MGSREFSNLPPVAQCPRSFTWRSVVGPVAVGAMASVVQALFALVVPAPWSALLLLVTIPGAVYVGVLMLPRRSHQQCGCVRCTASTWFEIYRRREVDRQEAEALAKALIDTYARRCKRRRVRLGDLRDDIPGMGGVDALREATDDPRYVVVSSRGTSLGPHWFMDRDQGSDLLLDIAEYLGPWVVSEVQARVLSSARAYCSVQYADNPIRLLGPFEEATACAVANFSKTMGIEEAVRISRAVMA